MTSDFKRQEELFNAASEIESPAERAAYLAHECAGDDALLRRIEGMLEAGAAAAEYFKAPPLGSGAPLPAPASTIIGYVGEAIGRYRLKEKLGEGGFGVVYVAEQTEPVRRQVALKVVKPGMDTQEVIARFNSERQALAMMDHPNIAKVLDAGTIPQPRDRPYFVMELVRGSQITDYCDHAKLRIRDRLELFIQVCRAVQHAHQKGVIHRDLKPSNILVEVRDGVAVPKIIDFGIAKAVEGQLTEASVHTQLHQLIGTPAYMSPEQAGLNAANVDTRSDIYSLGVLLYELLAGCTPFDTRELLASGFDVMRRTIRELEPVRPSTRLQSLQVPTPQVTATRRSTNLPQLIHEVRGDLDWIVMKCLEKDRSRRYETANGLAADVQRHLNHEPVQARPPDFPYRFQKWAKRNKLEFAATLAVAFSLLAGLAFSTWSFLGERKARAAEEAQHHFAEEQRSLAEEHGRKAAASEERMRRILYAADINLAQQAVELSNFGRARALLERTRPRPGEKDLRHWEWRYLWQLCQVDSHERLGSYSNRISAIALSPNQKWLAVVEEPNLDIWDVPSRTLVKRLYTDVHRNRGTLAFSPDSSILAVARTERRVALVETGAWTEKVTFLIVSDPRCLLFTADGTRLVVRAGKWETNVIHFVEATSGRILRTVAMSADAMGLGGAHTNPMCLSPDEQILAAGGGNGIIYLWREGQGWRHIGGGGEDTITTLAFSADGKKLFSGSAYSDFAIRVWDVATGSLERLLNGHSGWVSALVVSGDGKTLYSASADQVVRTWDLQTWLPLSRLLGHNDEVHCLRLSDDDTWLFSAGRNGQVLIWKPGQARPVATPSIPVPPPLRPRDGVVFRVNEKGELLEPLTQLGTNIVALNEDRSNLLAVSLSTAGEVATWQKPAFARMAQWTHSGAEMVGFCGANADFAFAARTNGPGALFETRTGRFIRAFPAAPAGATVLFIETSQEHLVRGLDAGRLEVFSLRGSEPAAVFQISEFRNAPSATEVRGKPWIVIGSEDGLIQVVDVEVRRLLYGLRGHLMAVHSLAVSPDGKRLASGGTGREAVKVWDLEMGQELLTLSGAGDIYQRALFSDDEIVVRAPSRNRERGWKAPAWEEIRRVEGKTSF